MNNEEIFKKVYEEARADLQRRGRYHLAYADWLEVNPSEHKIIMDAMAEAHRVGFNKGRQPDNVMWDGDKPCVGDGID